ncbi:MAG: serine--tRNA ligase [Endomicrobium sp.]|jgi:seryl-tRNA synthetase|nr:serine--tRNA ligase [Endomicrobium sp.]
MLDIKFIEKNINFVKNAILSRNIKINLTKLLKLYHEKKKKVYIVENLKFKKNKKIKNIHYKQNNFSKNTEYIKLKDTIKKHDEYILLLENKIKNILLKIPNIPDESVPIGKDHNSNKVIKFIGTKKIFSFIPKHHWEIGEKLNIFDFARASKISGTRFTIIKNEGCVLERAIASFLIDIHKKNGYTEIAAPYLVNEKSMIGTGQLPKFKKEMFKCSLDNLYLIPTSEVSITNIYREEVLEELSLPKKFVSYSACFRRESGSYGKDTKGLIRNHQFNKVELVKFVSPSESNKELEILVSDVSNVLKLLKLPFRIVLLSTGDISFSSSKTYDLEVWFPGYKSYKEISSCSNFKDFQSRRMNIKIKYTKSKKNDFLHTLNGSGVAIGRIFAAILENYQQKDGSVIIPDVLHKYTKFSIMKCRNG